MREGIVGGHRALTWPGESTWVLLHGFTGAPESWAAVMEAAPADAGAVAIALPGHGGPTRADPARSFEAAVDDLAAALAALPGAPHPVCGYSLGGRVALGLLDRHPDIVPRVVAIGAHPGLPEAERPARAAWDEGWARRFEAAAAGAARLSEVLAAWQALPVFSTQARLPPGALAAQDDVRRRHDPAQLAASLRQMGLARMPIWAPAPRRVRYLVGAWDDRFTGIAEALERRWPGLDVQVAPAAGHNLVLEAPTFVAAQLWGG